MIFHISAKNLTIDEAETLCKIVSEKLGIQLMGVKYHDSR